jgi:hypothetical protein
MAFYTIVRQKDQAATSSNTLRAAALVGPTDHKCALKITHDGKDYKFEFIKPQYVINDDDMIKFEVVNDTNSKAKDIQIIKHCCTEPAAIKVMDKINRNLQIIPGAAYPSSSVHVKFDMTEFQMIHIGLIVEITPSDPTEKSELLLCDPQVGSGPP